MFIVNKGVLAAVALVAAGFSATASAATATANFDVKITITATCSVTAGSASDINFSTHPTSDTNIDASNSISVTCSKRQPYNIGLKPQNTGGGNVGDGVMNSSVIAPTDTVAYNLYSDAARTKAWGNNVTSSLPAGTGNGVAGTGNGSPISHTVYGRVPSANSTPADYKDTVLVTVTY